MNAALATITKGAGLSKEPFNIGSQWNNVRAFRTFVIFDTFLVYDGDEYHISVLLYY